jgi:hypothetical protein
MRTLRTRKSYEIYKESVANNTEPNLSGPSVGELAEAYFDSVRKSVNSS